MAESSVRGAVGLGRIASTIAVSDTDRAVEFYCRVLGMRVTFSNGDPVGFVILNNAAAELHLTLVAQHRGSAHNVAHLMVDDATGLYDQLVDHQVRIIKGLRGRQLWPARLRVRRPGREPNRRGPSRCADPPEPSRAGSRPTSHRLAFASSPTQV